MVGTALNTCGNLVPWSAPVARSYPLTVEHHYLPCLGCYETPKMMDMEYGGGGERTGTGGVQEADRKAGSSGVRSRGATTKILFR